MTDNNEIPADGGKPVIENVTESVAEVVTEKPAEKPKQVKSVEIVSIFGTDKISGVSSFEDLPDRVNVSGHIEEMVEYEREGKLVKDIKNIPACVSVPRSAIISMNKTYHQ
jgi:hypothetical protein